MGFGNHDQMEAVHILHPRKLFQVIDEENSQSAMHYYCRTLIGMQFYGQTSVSTKTDMSIMTDDSNLGTALENLDLFLRKFINFDVEKEEFFKLIEEVSRYRKKSNESCEECCKRLKKDGKRFLEIYKARAAISEILEHKKYWGTRQQLLSGKVIADWIDVTYGAMDPIFGVLLNPTTGRVGPSDSSLVHEILFDENGRFAYHSAVHDAFGYLITAHGIGPGYDYLQMNVLDKQNIFAGQYSGLSFWTKAVQIYIRKTEIITLA